MKSVLWLLPLVAACTGDSTQVIGTGNGEPAPDPDVTEPVIIHTPITASQPYGAEIAITATVTDEESDIFIVTVNYRREDSTVPSEKGLQPMGDGTFKGQIPATDVESAGMYYWLYAMDSAGNEALLPEDGEDDAYHFRISGADTGL